MKTAVLFKMYFILFNCDSKLHLSCNLKRTYAVKDDIKSDYRGFL